MVRGRGPPGPPGPGCAGGRRCRSSPIASATSRSPARSTTRRPGRAACPTRSGSCSGRSDDRLDGGATRTILQRFIDAQQGVIDGALRELRAGRKTGHWIWFVFPQLTGARPQRAVALLRHRLARGSARVPCAPGARASACASAPPPCSRSRIARQRRSWVPSTRRSSDLDDAVPARRPGRAVVPPVLDRYFAGSPTADRRVAGTRRDPTRRYPSGVPPEHDPPARRRPRSRRAHARRAGAPLGRRRRPHPDHRGGDDRGGPQGAGAGYPRRAPHGARRHGRRRRGPGPSSRSTHGRTAGR